MRILLFTENSHSGGLDSFLVTLINHWPHPEDELTLMCNARHPGLEVIAKRLRRPCRIVGHRIRLQWELMRRIERIPGLRRLRKPISALLRYPFFAAYLAALRKLIDECPADRLMVVNGGYPGGDTCRAAAIAWGRFAHAPPAVHNVHNLAVAPRWWERRIENAIDARVLRLSAAIVCVSKACAQAMTKRPAIGDSEKLVHIYDGIEAPPARGSPAGPDPREALGIPATSPMCLMLGTYEPRKGHRFLLEAFRRVLAEVPTAHLVVCGYGYPEQVAAVRDMVQALGLEANVHLERFRDDVRDLLRASTVLVVSSQSFESFGLTVVEAWAERLPVVATRVGGLPEVIGEDGGGFCLAADDVTGFADAIGRLLMDGALRADMGERGYRRFVGNFTAERMADQYAHLIRRA